MIPNIHYAEETWVDWCLSLDSEGLSLGLKVRLALNKGKSVLGRTSVKLREAFMGSILSLALKWENWAGSLC